LGAIESIAAIIVTRRWPKIDADPVQSGGINAGETMAGGQGRVGNGKWEYEYEYEYQSPPTRARQTGQTFAPDARILLALSCNLARCSANV